MDLHMPLLDGLDTARMIREREAAEGLRRVPIVAVTASEATTARDQAQESSMDGYLAKPVNREVLTRMIQSVLGAATAVQPRHTHSEARSDGSSLTMEELINIGGPEMAREGARCLRHTFQRAPNTARRRSRARRCIGGSGGFSQPEGKLPGARCG